jgi:protein O-mannosyl-transferase
MGQRPKKNQSPRKPGLRPPDRIPAGRELRTLNRYTPLAICGLLLLAVALVFGQTLNHEFVNFDDETYIPENQHLAGGFSTQAVVWAFTATDCSNWHPLTWLSYMLDHQLYGLKPWGYHLTNILLHAATAIALLLVLRQMTGDLWPSTFVAAVFALHPLRVESVAWAAERKDLLSGLFFMLTVGAYVVYVRRPFSLVRYALVIGLFALGLMAKPMLVTLPLVLLLLDYWPLGRMVSPSGREGDRSMFSDNAFRAENADWPKNGPVPWRLLVEKLPLLALSAASCAITSVAQGDAIKRLDLIPLSARIANALVSYVVYMGRLFYPVGLAVAYPHQGNNLPAWQVAGALLVLACISVGVLAWRWKCPYLLVGWCWYLGMLVPVIGLVQVGLQAMADRYTYLPQIGLLIGLTWAAKRLLESWPHRVWACGAAALILAVLTGCAWQQTSYWRNSETLWRHAIDSTLPNTTAHYNLGEILDRRGQTGAAMAEYRKALEIKPDNADAHTNLGIDLAGRGQADEAIAHFREVLKIMPDYAEVHYNLSISLLTKKQYDEAIVHLRRAIEIKPEFAAAQNNLGLALARSGRLDEAIAHYQKALELEPNYADARRNMANALNQKERAK